MTTEPGQGGDTSRRKFDDIASLFGTIVPPPGPAARLVEDHPAPRSRVPELIPTTLREPRPPAPIAAPPEPSAALQVQPALKLEPKPAERPRPAEIPWPDAFEPRPNFRKREPRNWSWLLLIPVGFVAAVAISLIDPRAIRAWLDANVLHRTPVSVDIGNPLLPAPFRTPAAQNAQSSPPPATPVPEPEAPIAYPAIPTSPVPVPPGADVSPPPPEPAETAAAASTPIHIMIQYRRNIPGADGEARRIAALLQSYGGSIELHPNTTTVRAPTINYYNAADKSAASALAAVLANEASGWLVRASTAKAPPGTLDVWLP